ncbi:MAG: hypothetical protein K6G31_02125 [Paludibacteraceae bacterium]|nr:hypothetical protein [Paludibacteraceae bacterium]
MKGLLIALVLIGFCTYAYKRREAKLGVQKRSGLDSQSIESLVKNKEPEKIDRLQFSDITSYFKMLNLKKGEDVPFVYREDLTNNSLVMATFKETTQKVENLKYVVADEIDVDIKNMLGNEKLVVLN